MEVCFYDQYEQGFLTKLAYTDEQISRNRKIALGTTGASIGGLVGRDIAEDVMRGTPEHIRNTKQFIKAFRKLALKRTLVGALIGGGVGVGGAALADAIGVSPIPSVGILV